MIGDEDKINIKGIETWRPGDPLAAEKLNQPGQVLNDIGTPAPPGQVLNETGDFEIRLFKVVRLEKDVIIANFTDGNTDQDDEVKVAMPYLLRMTPFDSVGTTPVPALRDGKFEYTFTFTDDAGSARYDKRTSIDTLNDDDEEIQVITNKYDTGDLFFAARGISGGTGVFHDPETKEKPVIWQDMNYDGRAWAKSSETEEE